MKADYPKKQLVIDPDEHPEIWNYAFSLHTLDNLSERGATSSSIDDSVFSHPYPKIHIMCSMKGAFAIFLVGDVFVGETSAP